MLRLLTINQNPFAAQAVTTFGLAVLLMVAVVSLGLWFIVAQGRARRESKAFDDKSEDPLQALRQEDLVVDDASGARGPKDTVVARLVRAPQQPNA